MSRCVALCIAESSGQFYLSRCLNIRHRDRETVERDSGYSHRDRLSPQNETNRNVLLAVLYRLHGEILKTVSCAKYLVVNITSNLSWGSHMDRITNSANKTLGFIKRNVGTKMSGVREASYRTLVRPQLEYAVAIWDPHNKVKTEQIEKVQRRAAHWTTCNFDRMASFSAMLETLGWRTLEQRRADSLLCLFYKIVNNMVAVPLPDYIKPNPCTSHRGHSMTKYIWLFLFEHF